MNDDDTNTHPSFAPRGDAPEIAVALDVSDAGEALAFVRRLRPAASWFKIGSQLFTAAGPAVVRDVIATRARVFLDLKFHDIPNTVAAASREAARLGVDLFNVHAAGGTEMMRRALDAAHEEAARRGATESERPRVIAVTVLTSHDAASVSETGVDPRHTIADHVIRLAALARRAGLDGVVASVHETASIKRECGDDFLVVTPGVRPTIEAPDGDGGSQSDDQRRVATPADAARAGADMIVVGRTILRAADPAGVIDDINAELGRTATDRGANKL